MNQLPVVVDYLQENPETYSIILSDVARLRKPTQIDFDREEVVGIITNVSRYYDRSLFIKYPYLKFVASPSTGLTHINLTHCKELNLSVISLKGEAEFLKTVYATAEHTFALILALVRELAAATRDTSDGIWNRDKFCGMELHGKTLGIIGYGRVGKQVADIAIGFGMEVLSVDIIDNKYAERKRQLLRKSDIVSVHVPYMRDTHGMFDAAMFRQMKYGSYFINTSRGEVVKEEDLLLALRDNISGAALDVVCNEHGVINKELFDFANDYPERLILTPHIAGRTEESRLSTDRHLATMIRGYLK